MFECRMEDADDFISYSLTLHLVFLRLTPPYMLIIGFWTTLFQFTGEGANWAPLNLASGKCNETWWTNLLYVNNIVKQEEMVSIGEAFPARSVSFE